MAEFTQNRTDMAQKKKFQDLVDAAYLPSQFEKALACMWMDKEIYTAMLSTHKPQNTQVRDADPVEQAIIDGNELKQFTSSVCYTEIWKW